METKERERARETERKKEKKEKRKRSKSPSPRRESSPPPQLKCGKPVDEGCEVGMDEFISKRDFEQFKHQFTQQHNAQFERLEALLSQQLVNQTGHFITSTPGVASSSQSHPLSKRHKPHNDAGTSNTSSAGQQGPNQLEPGPSRPAERQSPPPLLRPHVISDSDTDDEEDSNDGFNALNRAMFSPPVMSTDTSVLDSISSCFIENEERGDDISDKVASAVQTALEGDAIRKEELEKIFDNYLVPKNINNLRVPRVKEEVWEFLPTNTKTRDLKDREIVNMVVKSMAITSKLLDITFSAQSKNELIKPSEIFNALADKTKIEATTFHELNEQRKNKIQPFFRYQFKKLCKNKNKTNEFLFGESLSEEVKAIKETASVIDNIQGITGQPGNAFRRGRFNPRNPPATTHHNKRGSKPMWKAQQKKGLPHQSQRKGGFPKYKRKFHQ